jgi:hypothetical protein
VTFRGRRVNMRLHEYQFTTLRKRRPSKKDRKSTRRA